MESMIELRKASKSFSKDKIVIDHVSINLKKHECIAILGHNGSGKSTVLKMIAGLIPCTSGEIIYAEDCKIGYAPEQFPKLRFTAEQYLYAMGRIQGLHKSELKQEIRELLHKFKLNECYHMTYFSKGMLQKVNLLQAVLGNPTVLILDEPLSGLDASSQSELITMLQIFKNQGLTIVLTCHENSLLNGIADRIVVIKDGEIHSDNSNIQSRESLFKIIYTSNGSVEAIPISDCLDLEMILSHRYGKELIVKEENRDYVMLQLLRHHYSITSVTKEIDRKSVLELTSFDSEGESS